MMDVIQRNIERLIESSDSSQREPLEPMTEWKWQQLYLTARKYGIGPWIADGIEAYRDDFFLQLSPTLYQQMMCLQGDKDPQCMERYRLQMERSACMLHHLTPTSLRAYAKDLIGAIKNIEE